MTKCLDCTAKYCEDCGKPLEQGGGKLPPPSTTIDCSADPFCPDWLKVEYHEKGPKDFDPANIELHLDERQKNGTITGDDLRKKLPKTVLNACVLDFLFANPNLIPEDWKQDSEGRTRYIFFWGTVYRNSDGRLYVRCLDWYDGRWRWGYDWLGNGWDGRDSAAVFAST